MRLANKVAIITGAASGIGRATAIRFAHEGAKVVIADVNREGGQSCADQIVAAGGQAMFTHTDLSKDADVQAMIDAAANTYGGLDILHNNAYWTDPRTAADTTPEIWQRTLDVSLRPVWLASKLAIPHLQARGKGVILNTASVHSIVGFTGYAAYQAAKGGMLSLTRALSLELAPTIRVVAILPGAINAPALHLNADSFIKELIEDIPMARLGEPEEIANVALFLASDEASYITGTAITVDGGYTTR